ncbi:MAG: carboxypeptidase-like regulatory domain-containing protein, partial [Terriglobales bacterium]
MKTASLKIFAVLVALLLVVSAAQLFAQSSTSGDVAGVVTDPTGAVVPGATVTLSSAAKGTSRTTTTTSTGAYRFSLIQPGDYIVTVTAPKFATTEARVSIAVGSAATQDIKLAVASGATTVEVTAAAPLINTESADNSSTFEQKQIENLPNGGSDLTYIAQTAPGVVMNTGSGYGNFTANGLPATSNVFTVDGNNQMDPFLNLNNSGPTNLMLGKNSIAEASVVTNAYSGEYGQQAGAQVNYVSKGGTNQY